MAEDCIFTHSDEAIYCETVVLQWLNEGKYDKVVNILGGFHQHGENQNHVQKLWGNGF